MIAAITEGKINANALIAQKGMIESGGFSVDVEKRVRKAGTENLRMIKELLKQAESLNEINGTAEQYENFGNDFDKISDFSSGS